MDFVEVAALDTLAVLAREFNSDARGVDRGDVKAGESSKGRAVCSIGREVENDRRESEIVVSCKVRFVTPAFFVSYRGYCISLVVGGLNKVCILGELGGRSGSSELE